MDARSRLGRRQSRSVHFLTARNGLMPAARRIRRATLQGRSSDERCTILATVCACNFSMLAETNCANCLEVARRSAKSGARAAAHLAGTLPADTELPGDLRVALRPIHLRPVDAFFPSSIENRITEVPRPPLCLRIGSIQFPGQFLETQPRRCRGQALEPDASYASGANSRRPRKILPGCQFSHGCVRSPFFRFAPAPDPLRRGTI